MSPLQHAHARLEVVAHADFWLDPGLGDEPFIPFRYVVADVLEPLLPRRQWTGYAPDHDTCPLIGFHDDTAMGYGTAARHAEGATDDDVSALDIHFTAENGIMGDDDFTGTGIFREMLEIEFKFPIQGIPPG